MGHVTVRRSHGHREIGVSRIVDRQSETGGNRAPGRALRKSIAGVAGRDHHHDTGLDEPVHLDAQRALAARKPFRLEVVADAHVDSVHADITAISVDALNHIDRRDQVAGLAHAIIIQNLEAQQLAFRGHARNPGRMIDLLLHLAGFAAVLLRELL
jgi:hypothetical protein